MKEITNQKLDRLFPIKCLICGIPLKRTERKKAAFPCPNCGFEQCSPEAKLVVKAKEIQHEI